VKSIGLWEVKDEYDVEMISVSDQFLMDGLGTTISSKMVVRRSKCTAGIWSFLRIGFDNVRHIESGIEKSFLARIGRRLLARV
jgi:hypothetical protein